MSLIHRLSVHSQRDLFLPAIVTEVDEGGGTISVESGGSEHVVDVPEDFDFNNVYVGAAIVVEGSKGAGYNAPITATTVDIGLLRIQTIDFVQLNWNGVQDIFSINPADHIDTDSFIAGTVVSQPGGGTGTITLALGDNEVFSTITPGTIGHFRDYNTSGWPSHVSSLFTETQKTNSAQDFVNTYGIGHTNTSGWATQSSFVAGMKYRDSITGGLGRPDGNIIGYVYVPHIFYLSGAWRT